MADSARVVVIGGGVAGTSVAFHLAERGVSDVILLEQSELTWGTTFHSAAFVGQLRAGVHLTRMMMDSVAVYRRLAGEQDLPWKEVGSLRLASSNERWEELTRLAAWAETFDLPVELVSTERALEIFPFFNPQGVHGALHIPTDGYLDPSELALAFARGAAAGGVSVRTGVRVTGIDTADGRVRAVQTDDGPIETAAVVNCGGIWAHGLGAMAGVNVPVVPLAHEYLRDPPDEGTHEDLCTMRDPDLLIYFRPWEGGFVMGGYPAGRRAVPCLRPDPSRFQPHPCSPRTGIASHP